MKVVTYNTLRYQQLLELAAAIKIGVIPVSPPRGVEAVVHFEGTVIAKQRARAGASGKHYTPQATRDFEDEVGQAGMRAMIKREMPDCLMMPLSVKLTIRTLAPKNWPAWKVDLAYSQLIFPDKQDTDNKIKSIWDGLNGIVWGDDRQICRMIVEDIYDTEEGFVLTATPAGLTMSEADRLGAILKGL
jgi:Holliday junction resolvase RusA-like endonuclease